MTRRHSTIRGFTLMELIITISIVGFMVFAMNSIFNEATTIVRRGTQTGEIIQRARALDQQLKQETGLEYIEGVPRSKMLGPYGNDNIADVTPLGGILAIVQHRIDSVPLTPEDVDNGNLRPVRSDQLMFIYDQTMKIGDSTRRLRALAPASDSEFSGNLLNSHWAGYARVWYGHVQSLRRNGAHDNANELGAYNAPDNPNAYAIDWVLGRHVLFLTGTNTTPPTTPNDRPILPIGNRVNGYAPTGSVSGGGLSGQLRSGVADVSNVELAEITGPWTPGNPFPAWLSAPGATAQTYQDHVLGEIMFAEERLRTQAKSADVTGGTTAQRLAPMHTAFMTGVSDFIVEWAGDMYTANASGFVPQADLIAQTYAPDGLLDRDINGEIVWYSHYANVPGTPNYDPDMPITWVPPGPPDYYPSRPGPAGSYAAGGAFVWQHYVEDHALAGYGPDDTDPQNAWPWMLRIRYRIHDRLGDYVGRQILDGPGVNGERIEERGEWFETIVPVNRQFPYVP